MFFGDCWLATAYPLVGAAVVGRRPGNRVERCSCSRRSWATCWRGSTRSRSTRCLGRRGCRPRPPPGSRTGASSRTSRWSACSCCVPDGRPASPRWGVVVRVVVAALVVGTLARMLAEPVDASRGAVTNPLGLAVWPNALLLAASWVCFAGGGPLGVVALGQRLRRATGVERAQLQWLLLGGVGLLSAFVGSFLLPDRPRTSCSGWGCLHPARGGRRDAAPRPVRRRGRAVADDRLVVAHRARPAGVRRRRGRRGHNDADRRTAYAVVAVAALVAASGRDRCSGSSTGCSTAPGATRTRWSTGSAAGSSWRPDPRRAVAAGRRARGGAPAAVRGRLPRTPARPCRQAPPLRRRGVAARVGPVAGSESGASAPRRGGEELSRPSAPRDRASPTRRAALEAARCSYDLALQPRADRRRAQGGTTGLRHELHDGVGPELAGMALQLQQPGPPVEGDPSSRSGPSGCATRCAGTVAAVRRAVDDLRPAGARRARAGRGAAPALAAYASVGAAADRWRPGGCPCRSTTSRRCRPPSRSRPTGSRPRRWRTRRGTAGRGLAGAGRRRGGVAAGAGRRRRQGARPWGRAGRGADQHARAGGRGGRALRRGPGPSGGTVLRALLPRATR